jgi:hypothetical protein
MATENTQNTQNISKKRIAVIDGQGGGVGRALVAAFRAAFGPDLRILALGTNASASAVMLKAGADEAATGENAVVVNCPKVDVIAGAIGILAANAMLGELTPAMARAVADSPAEKLLLPLNRCGLRVVGVESAPMAALLDRAAADLSELLRISGEH